MISTTDNIAARPPASLTTIEAVCADYDAESAKLESMVADLEKDLEAVKQKHLPGLKRQAAVVARREAEGISAVESAPNLFVKPRTVTVHGVKAGYSTSVGKLAFDDGDTVVKLIRRYRKDDADVFIRTVEEPNKDSLKTLPREELQRLGCRIEGAGDLVVFKRVAGDVERLINKLIEKLVQAMVKED
jgi:hypothetical protein